jgi:hypothetical protein
VILADAAVVEQQAQPVVVEVAVSTGDPLGVLDFQVEVFWLFRFWSALERVMAWEIAVVSVP